jgi:DNA modification methylase
MFVMSKGKPKSGSLIKDRENSIKSGRVKVNGSLNKEGKGKYREVNRKPYGKRTNIWTIDTQKKSNHPAPFPETLAQDHIISWSNENDVVFDPFMGSGTTGKMALLNNRKFIGIEKDDNYFEIAQKRIGEALKQKQQNLFDK